jgi:hypothetical protein
MEITIEERNFRQKIEEGNASFEFKTRLIGELERQLRFAEGLEKFRLEGQLKEEEEEREKIVEQVKDWEEKLRRLKLEGEKKELIQHALKNELAQSFEEAIEKWKMIHDLDPADPNAGKQIKKLEDRLQYSRQLEDYISQIVSRRSEIPIYVKVIGRLQNMQGSGQEDTATLSAVEDFLLRRTQASEFMEYWKDLEKNPSTAAEGQPKYAILADRLQRGEVILCLGSDIPRLSGINKLELHRLIQELAKRADYENFTGSLSMIAQYYEMSDYGRPALVRNLNTFLNEGDIPEINIYKLLANIEQRLILISTTYDMFLENYFRAFNKRHVIISPILYNRENFTLGDSTINLNIGNIVICYSDKRDIIVLSSKEELSNLKGLENYSIIYKILGYCESFKPDVGRDAWTLTEENYYEFARNIGNSIPDYIVNQFKDRLIYFVGYSIQNWEDRLLVSLILNRTQYVSAKVITQPVDSFERAYWKWKKVEVYPVDLEEFVTQLEANL